ncbi:MAG: hypothetical protein JNL41_05285 [Phenylobacterium sp.]|uniref:hypothetical protein n=1 Tax=Phenylobacterium sp. TaxID=1871053 RepID=UPI001A571313|nr:hypothetical protein [Phenylobacterium sp.]MBL8553671.1 hypothetical protein [Phenylobacterium sp.]
MRALIPIAAAAAVALPAAPAAADAVTDKADVRCMLVLRFAARDPKAREMAVRGAHYYMGRLAARGPVARLEPVIVGEGRAMNSAAAAQAEFQRCAGELQKNQTEFQALDQKLAGENPAAPASGEPSKAAGPANEVDSSQAIEPPKDAEPR